MGFILRRYVGAPLGGSITKKQVGGVNRVGVVIFLLLFLDFLDSTLIKCLLLLLHQLCLAMHTNVQKVVTLVITIAKMQIGKIQDQLEYNHWVSNI
jgi:predicted branched-subunit amino acid permease